MTRRLRKIVPALVALVGGSMIGTPALAQSTPGSWTHFPPQVPVFSSVVRSPIKLDGSSTFNDGSVIPVKFKLLTGPGTFLFDSVWSNNEGDSGEHNDDFANLTFTPSSALTFADITTLSADYTFAIGNCQGGSLRWSVTLDIGNDDSTVPAEGDPDPRDNDRSVFIYYGDYPNYTDCTTGANNQSGVNLMGSTDLRFDTSQIGGTFYDTHANATVLAGTVPIAGVTLALDSGWMQEVQDDVLVYKDQSVSLTHAQVNGATFVPISGGPPTATCDLPVAAITVVEDTAGNVENPLSVQNKFTDTFFRNTNECTYSYSLNTDSLFFGPGHYTVYLVIDNHVVLNPGRFTLK
jgi:hypothetical protein